MENHSKKSSSRILTTIFLFVVLIFCVSFNMAAYESDSTVGTSTSESNFTVLTGSPVVRTLDLSEIDCTKPITLSFDFAQNGTANGADRDSAVLKINGKRTLRVTGGGGTHIWDEGAGSFLGGSGGQYWNYTGGNYPATKLTVTVTINIPANTVNFVYGNKDLTLTSLDLSGETLTFSFGGETTPELRIENLCITYTEKVYYNATFVNGDDVIGTCRTEGEVTMPSALSKLGYTFLGWSDGISVFSAGATVNITGNTTFSAVWENLYTNRTFSVEQGSSQNMPIYLENVDVNSPVVVEFDFAQNGTANGASPNSSVLKIDGKRTFRVTGGGALHVWNDFAGTYLTSTTWRGNYYHGNDYPNTKIHVKLTIDAVAGSVRFEYTDSNSTEYDATLSGWDFSDGIIDLEFGGSEGKEISVSGFSVNYTERERDIKYYINGEETANVPSDGKYVAYITTMDGVGSYSWNYSSNSIYTDEYMSARSKGASVYLFSVSKLYDSADALKNDTSLVSGSIVGTKAYYPSSGRGAAVYQISSTSQSGSLALANGLYANIVPFDKGYEKSVTVDMFGAKGDGVVSDSAAINKALNFSGVDIVEFESDIYLQTSLILITKSNTVINGRGARIINDYSTLNWFDFGIGQYGSLTLTENVTLKNLTLECTETSGHGILYQNNDHVQLLVSSAKNITVDSCRVIVPNNSDEDRHITSVWFNNNVSDLTFKNSTVINHSSSSVGGGVWVSATADGTVARNIKILNNHIEKSSHDEVLAFFIGDFENVEIDGNYIYTHSEPEGNTSDHAIGFGVWGVESSMTNVTFTNNTVDVVTRKDAIMFGDVNGLSISGNNIRVSNNTTAEVIGHGVFRVPSSDTVQTNIEIYNNNIEVFCNAVNTSEGYNVMSITYDLGSGFNIHNNSFTINANIGYLSFAGGAMFRNNNFYLSSPTVVKNYTSGADFDSTNTISVVSGN